MNSEYCIHCGSKVLFRVNKPETCPKCNGSLNAVAQSSQQAVSTPSSVVSFPQQTDVVPKIPKHEVSISVEVNTARPMKLGELVGTADKSEAPAYRPQRNLPKDYNPLLDSMQSCAPIKSTKDINE